MMFGTLENALVKYAVKILEFSLFYFCVKKCTNNVRLDL